MPFSYSIPNEVFIDLQTFKIDPLNVIGSTNGSVLAVKEKNKTVFYCIPVDIWSNILNVLEDNELSKVVSKRLNDKTFRVNIDDL